MWWLSFFIFYKGVIFYMFVWMYSTCVYMPAEAKKELWTPEVGVVGRWEQADMGAGNWSLKEWYVLCIAQPSSSLWWLVLLSSWHHLESSGKSLSERLSRSAWPVVLWLHLWKAGLHYVNWCEKTKTTRPGVGSWTVWVHKASWAVSVCACSLCLGLWVTRCFKFQPWLPQNNEL